MHIWTLASNDCTTIAFPKRAGFNSKTKTTVVDACGFLHHILVEHCQLASI